MVFSSIIFLFCFLPIILFLYYIPCRKSMTAKNVCLFVGSLLFYAFGEGRNVILLLGTILLNYTVGHFVTPGKGGHRKLILGIAVVLNLSLLFVYKYLDFSISNINFLFHMQIPLTHIALPIGISFFTFQAISYIVDVYRGNAEPQKNPLYTGLYIALFPQLIAGPIVRYASIAEQMHGRTQSREKFAYGIERFLTGMGKKVLIADIMSLFADRIISDVMAGESGTVLLFWFAAACFTFRVYFDFSGYSDMAIGLGAMFGFHFDENFDYPYISTSISEYWRRWHISLQTWFRDYVYIPLGGSRVSRWRWIFNVCLVWLATGVWHGANWTFIIWGLLNFAFLVFEHATGYQKKWKLPKVLAHFYTMFLVGVGWVIFFTPNMQTAIRFLGGMFGIGTGGIFDRGVIFYLKDNWVFFVAAVLFSTPVGRRLDSKRTVKRLLLCIVFLLCVLYIMKGNYSPFIYFNF